MFLLSLRYSDPIYSEWLLLRRVPSNISNVPLSQVREVFFTARIFPQRNCASLLPLHFQLQAEESLPITRKDISQRQLRLWSMPLQ